MLEDKELGLKVAENPEEAFWTRTKEKCEKEIESLKHEIIINEAIIELAENKIKQEGGINGE